VKGMMVSPAPERAIVCAGWVGSALTIALPTLTTLSCLPFH